MSLVCFVTTKAVQYPPGSAKAAITVNHSTRRNKESPGQTYCIYGPISVWNPEVNDNETVLTHYTVTNTDHRYSHKLQVVTHEGASSEETVAPMQKLIGEWKDQGMAWNPSVPATAVVKTQTMNDKGLWEVIKTTPVAWSSRTTFQNPTSNRDYRLWVRSDNNTSEVNGVPPQTEVKVNINASGRISFLNSKSLAPTAYISATHDGKQIVLPEFENGGNEIQGGEHRSIHNPYSGSITVSVQNANLDISRNLSPGDMINIKVKKDGKQVDFW